MKNNLIFILAAAIMLRVVLSAASMHPDLLHFVAASEIINSGHILDFYDQSSADQLFNYPPVIYLLSGGFGFLLTPIVGAEIGWQMKLMYLLFDITAGLMLMKLFTTNKQKLLALGLWLFNPINLYATYLMGQFDVIPTMFVILSLLLLQRKQEALGALSLGVGIAFKIFPIFLLVPYLLQVNGWGKRIILAILALVPYILGNLAYISSDGFRASALVASQSLKSFYASIPVSGGQSILLFPAVLILIYGLFLYQNKDIKDLWKKFFVTLSLFFIFTHTHPQWLVWLSPFLIISLIETNFKYWVIVKGILVVWFITLFFFDPSLTVGIFAPINPGLSGMPSIWEQLGINMDYNFSRSLLHSLFTGLLALLAIVHVRSEKS